MNILDLSPRAIGAIAATACLLTSVAFVAVYPDSSLALFFLCAAIASLVIGGVWHYASGAHQEIEERDYRHRTTMIALEADRAETVKRATELRRSLEEESTSQDVEASNKTADEEISAGGYDEDDMSVIDTLLTREGR